MPLLLLPSFNLFIPTIYLMRNLTLSLTIVKFIIIAHVKCTFMLYTHLWLFGLDQEMCNEDKRV